MFTLQFTSIIKIRGINPYIAVSAARAAKIRSGWKKSLPVLARINGEPKKYWRINMMPVGDGGFYLYLHGSVRKASATKVGDRVRVEVRFDSKYRGGPAHPMPSWFRSALQKTPTAEKSWDALIPSRQKERLRYFFGLELPEVRARNVE